MRTTAAVRDFTDEPVEDEALRAILDDARFAPSGGNRQGWKVAVVKDPTIRRSLADLCAPVWGEYLAQAAQGETPFSVQRPTTVDLDAARREPPPNPLFDQIESVPVVLVVAVDLGALAVSDKDLERHSIVGGGSIYPFCHNLLLAARDHGLGGVLTTFLADPDRGVSAGGTPRRPWHRRDDLPRSPRAPGDPSPSRRGRAVQHHRPVRRPGIRPDSSA